MKTFYLHEWERKVFKKPETSSDVVNASKFLRHHNFGWKIKIKKIKLKIKKKPESLGHVIISLLNHIKICQPLSVITFHIK